MRDHLAIYLRVAYDLEYNPKHSKFDERARAEKLAPSRLRWLMGRWKAYLDATQSKPDPILTAWHAFATLPAAEFARKAPEVAKALNAKTAVARSFADKPPANMAEVVARYGELLSRDEEMRKRLFEANGPLVLTAEMLPRVLDRTERDRSRALGKKVEELQATHPGAPARAMVLNDRPHPGNARVFIRGIPGRRVRKSPGNS